jgi:hypothetical protein
MTGAAETIEQRGDGATSLEERLCHLWLGQPEPPDADQMLIRQLSSVSWHMARPWPAGSRLRRQLAVLNGAQTRLHRIQPAEDLRQ